MHRLLPLKSGLADISRCRVQLAEMDGTFITRIDIGHVPSLFHDGVRVKPGWGGSLPKYESLGISRFVKKITNLLQGFGGNQQTPLEKPQTVLFQPAPKFLTAAVGSRGNIEGEDSPRLIPRAIPAGKGIRLLKCQRCQFISKPLDPSAGRFALPAAPGLTMNPSVERSKRTQTQFGQSIHQVEGAAGCLRTHRKPPQRAPGQNK